MPNTYKVEYDEKYEGFRCVVILSTVGHRCGYVGVNEEHPLFNHEYGDTVPEELIYLMTEIQEAPVGKRGVIDLLCYDPKNPRVGILFDVHGGITYSGLNDVGYPVESDEKLWFFGYDCAHAEDTYYPKSLDYCIQECKSLAEQLGRISK